MRFDKFTLRGQEAVQTAVEFAERNQNQQVEPEHLLIAMLEHTSEPWRVLAEARRVLKPGGRVIIVVPNDVTMSAGRLVLGKFPIRYPDHLTFTTPGRMHKWLADGFRVTEEFPLPFRRLPYAVNLYYFMVAEAV